MSKIRKERQKQKKREYREENLDSKNAFGITDSTPREAVKNIMNKGERK